MIDSRTLIRRAAELMAQENSDTVVGRMVVSDLLMSEFGVTRARANTAVATAARRARTQRFADDADAATFTLRVRLTERQREHLQIMAEQETGGDMSKLVRRKVFA